VLNENKRRRLDEILAELADLNEKDRQFIRPRSLTQEAVVSMPVEELFAYGERNDRRTTLQEELGQLARES
jgi:hypothetical protein